ncbi:helix-turn-helix domain-containing protein, partial [Acinetobacter baumannii]
VSAGMIAEILKVTPRAALRIVEEMALSEMTGRGEVSGVGGYNVEVAPRLLPLNQSGGGYIFEQRPGVIGVSRYRDQGHRGAYCAQGFRQWSG